MINIFDIFSYIRIGIDGLIVVLVIILLIFVAVRIKNVELGPDCKKGFTKCFIAFILFILFSTFLDFAYSLTYRILTDLAESGAIDYYEITFILGIFSIATAGLGFLNNWIAYVILFSSMEIFLFNKKSKGKFGILAILLQIGSFILLIIEIVISAILGDYLGIQITNLVVNVLINFNFIIIGIVILILLGNTAKENQLLRNYTKMMSAGVILLLIIVPIFNQLVYVLNFISNLLAWNGYFFDNIIIRNGISWGIGFLSSLCFIIGIIVLSLGAIKTMTVPLTFSREKAAKGSPRQILNHQLNSCPSCGTSLLPGAEFCTNCGKHL
ncbi:zinc ribbon domain-containing protein [Promethearchaeum syntrophicum]|uniref:Zinc ribbon domain-containing protein n=1 Tax=Promethearchaeum syntrophicum TaxID=2594042 RepID=A0A5B9DC10_9ARCH|nr:zinc ribbon domain-containing protein [Candidatus Prometheoarchaeum syntrophicum]QEE16290.1 hypothetical protein DSAG12_02120 [Candidatus Prometheoarchaeum syntrophicum]